MQKVRRIGILILFLASIQLSIQIEQKLDALDPKKDYEDAKITTEMTYDISQSKINICESDQEKRWILDKCIDCNSNEYPCRLCNGDWDKENEKCILHGKDDIVPGNCNRIGFLQKGEECLDCRIRSDCILKCKGQWFQKYNTCIYTQGLSGRTSKTAPEYPQCFYLKTSKDCTACVDQGYVRVLTKENSTEESKNEYDCIKCSPDKWKYDTLSCPIETISQCKYNREGQIEETSNCTSACPQGKVLDQELRKCVDDTYIKKVCQAPVGGINYCQEDQCMKNQGYISQEIDNEWGLYRCECDSQHYQNSDFSCNKCGDYCQSCTISLLSLPQGAVADKDNKNSQCFKCQLDEEGHDDPIIYKLDRKNPQNCTCCYRPQDKEKEKETQQTGSCDQPCFQNCDQYKSGERACKCIGGFEYEAQSKICWCPIDHYYKQQEQGEPGKCIQCGEQCQECNEKGKCLLCKIPSMIVDPDWIEPKDSAAKATRLLAPPAQGSAAQDSTAQDSTAQGSKPQSCKCPKYHILKKEKDNEDSLANCIFCGFVEPNCLECNEDGCTKCINGYQAVDGKCVPAEQENIVKTGAAIYRCNQFIPGCSKCEDFTCKECQDPYFFNKQNKSCEKCPSNTYRVQKENGAIKCQECSDNQSCKICQSPTQCYLCHGDYKVENGKCVCTDVSKEPNGETCRCKDGYYLQEKKCVQCNLNCKKCQEGGQCLECNGQGQSKMNNGQTCANNDDKAKYDVEDPASKCKSDEYPVLNEQGSIKCQEKQVNQYYDKNFFKFQDCNANCETCEDNKKCTKCKNGSKNIENNECKCNPNEGNYLEDEQCKVCSVKYGEDCLECDKDNCLKCKDGQCLDEKKSCRLVKETQEFVDAKGTCQKCSNNCLTCKSDTKCEECQSNYTKLEQNESVECKCVLPNLLVEQTCIPQILQIDVPSTNSIADRYKINIDLHNQIPGFSDNNELQVKVQLYTQKEYDDELKQITQNKPQNQNDINTLVKLNKGLVIWDEKVKSPVNKSFNSILQSGDLVLLYTVQISQKNSQQAKPIIAIAKQFNVPQKQETNLRDLVPKLLTLLKNNNSKPSSLDYQQAINHLYNMKTSPCQANCQNNSVCKNSVCVCAQGYKLFDCSDVQQIQYDQLLSILHDKLYTLRPSNNNNMLNALITPTTSITNSNLASNLESTATNIAGNQQIGQQELQNIHNIIKNTVNQISQNNQQKQIDNLKQNNSQLQTLINNLLDKGQLGTDPLQFVAQDVKFVAQVGCQSDLKKQVEINSDTTFTENIEANKLFNKVCQNGDKVKAIYQVFKENPHRFTDFFKGQTRSFPYAETSVSKLNKARILQNQVQQDQTFTFQVQNAEKMTRLVCIMQQQSGAFGKCNNTQVFPNSVVCSCSGSATLFEDFDYLFTAKPEPPKECPASVTRVKEDSGLVIGIIVTSIFSFVMLILVIFFAVRKPQNLPQQKYVTQQNQDNNVGTTNKLAFQTDA